MLAGFSGVEMESYNYISCSYQGPLSSAYNFVCNLKMALLLANQTIYL